MKVPIPAPQPGNFLERLKPEALFLALTCTFGIAVLFANPPFQAPDENDHYARVFQLSEGTLVGEKRGSTSGGELPRLAAAVTDTEGIPFHSDRKMTLALYRRLMHPTLVDWSRAPRAYHFFPHTVVYAPAGYLPQTLALFLGRMAHIGPLGLMYLGRLGGFAASVALGYAALRALPAYRWTLLVVLSCPMSLYLFGSVASDGVLIGGAALLVALLAALDSEPGRRPTLREMAAVLALAGLLSLAKPVYLPLAGVALFVVLPRLASRRGRILFATAVAVSCVVPVLVWGRVAATVYAPADGNVPVDPVAQAHHILGAPIAFLGLVAHSIRAEYAGTFRWMVGTLGWGDTPMPDWFYCAFAYGILACAVLESGDAGIVRWRLRLVSAAAAAACVLLVYTAQYASWNVPGSRNPIEGIEGRYFLPVLPLVILSLPAVPLRPPRAAIAACAGALSLLCAVVCLWSVVSRYYVRPRSFYAGERRARLVGLSTRALVGSNETVLVTGIAVAGGGEETLLIRAEGPNLARGGLRGALAHPTLRVLDSAQRLLAANTRWENGPDAARIPSASDSVRAPSLPPGSDDSAMLVRLGPGKYTVEVSGAGGSSGIVREEVYELSHGGTRLSNLSSRAYVGHGDKMMVVGFAVAGEGTEAVLGRADGPSLQQFGVEGALARPVLEIRPYRGGAVVNTSWASSPDKADIIAASTMVGAYPLRESSADCAAVLALPPNEYTMRVYGAGGSTGIALAEIYELP